MTLKKACKAINGPLLFSYVLFFLSFPAIAGKDLKDPSVKIIFSGGIYGELEPCG